VDNEDPVALHSSAYYIAEGKRGGKRGGGKGGGEASLPLRGRLYLHLSTQCFLDNKGKREKGMGGKKGRIGNVLIVPISWGEWFSSFLPIERKEEKEKRGGEEKVRLRWAYSVLLNQRHADMAVIREEREKEGEEILPSPY